MFLVWIFLYFLVFFFLVFVLCLFDIRQATVIYIIVETEEGKNIQFKSGKQNAQIHMKKKTAQNTTHTHTIQWQLKNT